MAPMEVLCPRIADSIGLALRRWRYSVNPLEIIGADVVAEAEIIAPLRPAISLPSSCKAGRHHIASVYIFRILFPHGYRTEN